MISRLFLFLFYLFLFKENAFAQSLKEFIVTEIMDSDVFTLNISYENESVLNFYTLIPNLIFESNTGGIVDQKRQENRYIVAIKPENQVITIKASGYLETKIPLRNLKPKQSLQYRIETKKTYYNPNKGNLLITTNPPNATISIEGIPTFRELTPYEFQDFEAKIYKLSISKRGYSSVDTVIEIKEGLKLSIFIPLESKIGYLTLKTVKPVAFQINGQSYSMSGNIQTVEVAAGQNKLIINDLKYLTYEKTFNVKVGENLFVEPVLNPATGFLSISSNPPDARIIQIIDNEESILGVTPFSEEISADHYELIFRYPGLNDVRKTIKVEKEKTNTLFVDLYKDLEGSTSSSVSADRSPTKNFDEGVENKKIEIQGSPNYFFGMFIDNTENKSNKDIVKKVELNSTKAIIITSDFHFQLKVNNILYQHRPPASIIPLKTNQVSVEMIKADAFENPFSFNAELKNEQSIQLDPQLKLKEWHGKAFVETVPSDAEVFMYYNNWDVYKEIVLEQFGRPDEEWFEYVGKTPLEVYLEYGEIGIFIYKTGYKLVHQNFRSTIDPQKIKVVLEKM